MYTLITTWFSSLIPQTGKKSLVYRFWSLCSVIQIFNFAPVTGGHIYWIGPTAVQYTQKPIYLPISTNKYLVPYLLWSPPRNINPIGEHHWSISRANAIIHITFSDFSRYVRSAYIIWCELADLFGPSKSNSFPRVWVTGRLHEGFSNPPLPPADTRSGGKKRELPPGPKQAQ